MKRKYTVKGNCLVPCEVEMEVEATSEAEAVSIALASRWQDEIYSGYDDDAAFDWQPTAEENTDQTDPEGETEADYQERLSKMSKLERMMHDSIMRPFGANFSGVISTRSTNP